MVIEAQGPWSFGPCERLMREIDGLEADHLIVETSRMGSVDETAAFLMGALVDSLTANGTQVVFAGRIPSPLAKAADHRFETLDEALEWCENRILWGLEDEGPIPDSLDISESDIGRGLTAADAAALVSIAIEHRVEEGAVVVSIGDPAASMYLVTSGRLAAHVGGARVASFGPGSIVGEMAFLTGGVRSATILAEASATLLEISDLAGVPPSIRERVYRNIAVVVAERLNSTNQALAGART